MTRTTLVGLALALCVVGCGSADTGAAGEYLVSGIEGRTDLYVAPALDTRPMTLAQLGEENADLAIAVEVEIVGDVMVAWARDAAGQPIYSRDAIVGLWRVVDHDVALATPIDGELDHTPDGPVYTPGGTFGTFNRDGLRPTGSPGGESNVDQVDFSDLVDTSIFEDARAWHDLNEAHPGCA